MVSKDDILNYNVILKRNKLYVYVRDGIDVIINDKPIDKQAKQIFHEFDNIFDEVASMYDIYDLGTEDVTEEIRERVEKLKAKYLGDKDG